MLNDPYTVWWSLPASSQRRWSCWTPARGRRRAWSCIRGTSLRTPSARHEAERLSSGFRVKDGNHCQIRNSRRSVRWAAPRCLRSETSSVLQTVSPAGCSWRAGVSAAAAPQNSQTSDWETQKHTHTFSDFTTRGAELQVNTMFQVIWGYFNLKWTYHAIFKWL